MGSTSQPRQEADDFFPHGSKNWEQLLGSNNWEGFIEPLNLTLRKFILRCGDFCHSAYDAFAGPSGPTTATPAHSVKLQNASRYNVHSSLYATTRLNLLEKLLHIPVRFDPPAEGDHVPNWMGFCAATSDDASGAAGRREIYVAWRGTQRLFEWHNNLMFSRVASKCLLRCFNKKHEKKPKIMSGWLSIYTSTESSRVKKSARDQVKAEIGRLLEKYKGEEISIVMTGHSLGGILAILSAFDLVENEVGDDILIAAVVFGCPLVGDKAFKAKVEQHCNLKVLHVRNDKDFVPHFPLGKYTPLGKELVIDTAKSPIASVSESVSPGLFHDLEAALHMVSGWSGPNEEFVARINRSTRRLEETTKSFGYVKSEIELFVRRVRNIK